MYTDRYNNLVQNQRLSFLDELIGSSSDTIKYYRFGCVILTWAFNSGGQGYKTALEQFLDPQIAATAAESATASAAPTATATAAATASGASGAATAAAAASVKPKVAKDEKKIEEAILKSAFAYWRRQYVFFTFAAAAAAAFTRIAANANAANANIECES